ncbi:S8 family serine peptidase [Undibacterium sp.]|uniref:S8 family serine peptidase n=1 Tax=Undibacterium sp. TaxID=1914977 RepID=UPI00374D2721
MNSFIFHSDSPLLTSSNDGTSTSFRLKNCSSGPIRASWIGENGAINSLLTLASNRDTVFHTSSTHPWLIEYKNRKNLNFQFYPTHISSIDVTESGPIMSVFDVPRWSPLSGYGIVDVAKALEVPDIGATVTDAEASNAAALNLIKASSAWSSGYTGKGVTVAILDAGIAAHASIQECIADEYDAVLDSKKISLDPNYYLNHALGVACIVAGCHELQTQVPKVIGVAPEAKLMNIRITAHIKDYKTTADAAMARGIKWATDNGAKILCIPVQHDASKVSQLIIDALTYAKKKGVISVVIGGNYSRWGACGPALTAKQDLCIAVGNIDLSTRVPCITSNVPGEVPQPWVMASSSGIFPTADGGVTDYKDDWGTSFAGPYVAGVAALLVQKYPATDPEEIIQRITNSASFSA